MLRAECASIDQEPRGAAPSVWDSSECCMAKARRGSGWRSRHCECHTRMQLLRGCTTGALPAHMPTLLIVSCLRKDGFGFRVVRGNGIWRWGWLTCLDLAITSPLERCRFLARKREWGDKRAFGFR